MKAQNSPKAIMVMFDSLNRHMLPPYGAEWVKAPNFSRLADKAVTFDNSFVGSMPCMPARRELHTGRYNFLHRSWGPLEPFDDSMPEILKKNDIYTHLVSDHYHYWEEGGANYHTRYSSWECSRGQEGDPWKGVVGKIDIPENKNGLSRGVLNDWLKQDWVNRTYMQKIEEQPQAKTFEKGCEFIRKNHADDSWFLQIETFDPHEPYYTLSKYKELYDHNYDGPIWDWPPYRKVKEPQKDIEHMRFENAALISMCDEYLGKVLDLMDEYNLWQDTMLIVNTDHGFLLGEHGWWGKCVMPFYNEIAHTPLFIWDPRSQKEGERREALVQTIDLAPTLLEYFGVDIPEDMQGIALKGTIDDDQKIREAGLFGLHGGQVNIVEQRYIYMHPPASDNNFPLYEYTLMPAHMRHTFSPAELQNIELDGPFTFTKGCQVMKIPAQKKIPDQMDKLLFDLKMDPEQKNPIHSKEIEREMLNKLIRLMEENDAPREQFYRLGIT